MPLQMMISRMPGTGARGRLWKSWIDYVRDDLAAIGHAYGSARIEKPGGKYSRCCLTCLVLKDWKLCHNNNGANTYRN